MSNQEIHGIIQTSQKLLEQAKPNQPATPGGPIPHHPRVIINSKFTVDETEQTQVINESEPNLIRQHVTYNIVRDPNVLKEKGIKIFNPTIYPASQKDALVIAANLHNEKHKLEASALTQQHSA